MKKVEIAEFLKVHEDLEVRVHRAFFNVQFQFWRTIFGGGGKLTRFDKLLSRVGVGPWPGGDSTGPWPGSRPGVVEPWGLGNPRALKLKFDPRLTSSAA
jgi:hypothetical protein